MKMLKYTFLLLISVSSFGQNIFLADSTDIFSKFKTADNIGENIQKTDFNKQFAAKFGDWYDYNKQYQKLLTTKPDDWEMDLFETRISQIAFLKTNGNALTSTEKKRFENEINYNYWHLLFAFPVLNSNADQKLKRVISLPNVMTKGFKIDAKNLDSLFYVRSFRALIPFYVTYKNSEEHNFVKYADMVESVVDKSEYAIKTLKGNALDFALANVLLTNKDRITSSSVRYVNSQIENPEVQNLFKGEFLDKIIEKEEIALKEKKENEKKKSKGDMPQLTGLDGKIFDFSKYAGKIIYVDFWASWCGPCRGQMPFSKQMHEALSDKEKSKIVFLYISIDENEDAWKGAVEKLELQKFENGYSKGGWNSEVVKKYKIAGIPRYMIVDKTGKVISLEAKRPSDAETILELKQLIK